MAKTYWEKLKDPRWQKLKNSILDREKYTCQICGDTENTLHIHHGYYTKDYEPWDYHPDTLWCLCKDCHENADAMKHDIHKFIATVHPSEHEEMFAAMRLWLLDHYDVPEWAR